MGLNKRLIGAGATASGALTPSENFKVVTYTGDGADDRAIEVGFQPDFVWFKTRNQANDHNASDSTRGAAKQVRPNRDIAEVSATDQIKSFTSTGFTVGTGGDANGSGNTYVAWCWKANGGTTSSNTDGTITSTVQANQDSGFSIVKYTGTGSNASIGHNLGVAPEIIFIKKTSGSSDWVVGALEWTKYLELNGTPAFRTANVWQDTAPTNSVFTLTSGGDVNGSGSDYIAYAFASIDGFSKIGSYTGNGSTNGPIVETGFEPAFLMIKMTSGTGSWFMWDNKRSTTNPRKPYLYAQSANEEADDLGGVDFLSNGFQLKDSYSFMNGNNSTFIYMAFAADPDTEAPTLASSFNIETYTGNATSNRAITGLGYKPNFVWIKNRSAVRDHMLFDSLRVSSTIHGLYSNDAAAEFTATANDFNSFDDDGFTIGQDPYTNGSGNDLVAWSWKADDNEPTIIPAAGPDSVDNEYPVVNYHNITYTSSGKFNGGYVFNGTTATGTSGSAIFTPQFERNTSVDFTSSGVSASGWFYSTGSPSGNASHVLFSMYGDCGFNIQYNSSRTIIYSGAINGSTNKSMPSNAWTHFAFTYSSTGYLKVYVDGSASSSYNVGTSALQSGSPRVNGIGAVADNGDHTGPTQWFYSFQGTISQARYFNSELTQANVNTLYGESSSDNETLDILGDGKCIAAYTLSKELSEVSIISANANAGFSIVKYDGSGVSGTKIPHGLSASPNMILIKCTSDGSTNWIVHHSSLGNSKYLTLNDSSSQDTSTNWLVPSATTFALNQTFGNANTSGRQYIAYCFHDVSGYQKLGSYSGNGSTQSITTGFKVDFLLIKETDGTDSWELFDSRRGVNKVLYPNGSNAEGTTSNLGSFNSNGFTVSSATSVNENGKTYIYWAIAKNVPSNTTLANSFKAVAYTGNESTQSITGVGFKPDLVWVKANTTSNLRHMLFDDVRGAGDYISSNLSNAEVYNASSLTSFDSDGFSLGNFGQSNYGVSFIAWCWKAGNTWQSNIDGTMPTTVNANTANGFSIVKYTGQGGVKTAGHGLSSAPEMIIVKSLGHSANWYTYHIGLDASSPEDYNVRLDQNDARQDSTSYWDDTAPTNSVFTIGTTTGVSQNNTEFIAYCFHSVSGYSKIGSYSGTGSSNSITGLGFQPDFVMLKSSTSAENWAMFDSVRGSNTLNPNTDGGQSAFSTFTFDSDGFTVPAASGMTNGSGQTYIYMAFKMN